MPDDPIDWLRRRVSEMTPEALAEFKDEVTATQPAGTEHQLVNLRAGHGEMWAQVFVGPDVVLTGHVESLSLDRDYIDATVFGNPEKTYLVGMGRFTIMGRQQPLPPGTRHERIG